MITLIIPAYHPNKQLEKMTQNCIESVGKEIDELIVQIDEYGDGYTKTVNKALKNAKGDTIVIGNNDLIFHEGWLGGLLKVLDEGFDLATCWTSDQKYKKEPVIKEGKRFGSLFAMKRDVYETIGGFDEQFRGYFSDDDYRERLKQAGLRIGMNYNLVVEHLAKATYKEVDPEDKEFRRSKLLFEIKHGYIP